MLNEFLSFVDWNEYDCTGSLDNDVPVYWEANMCISMHFIEKHWFQATEICINHGGYLLTIRSDDEQLAMVEKLTNTGAGASFWLGLTKWHWYWADREYNMLFILCWLYTCLRHLSAEFYAC